MQTADENILAIQQELAADFNIPATSSKSDLLQALTVCINQLIQTDFAGLINLLYRIDIPEETIKKTLNLQHGENAAQLIASLLVERQLQKQQTRAQFKPQPPIPDDDKW